jgi:hypothetical protein
MIMRKTSLILLGAAAGVDPIIIGILVSSLHAMEALALRSFFELDLLKK